MLMEKPWLQPHSLLKYELGAKERRKLSVTHSMIHTKARYYPSSTCLCSRHIHGSCISLRIRASLSTPSIPVPITLHLGSACCYRIICPRNRDAKYGDDASGIKPEQRRGKGAVLVWNEYGRWGDRVVRFCSVVGTGVRILDVVKRVL